MKIITFGDYNYIPHLVNCYRNLKEFNRHNELTILSTDKNTVDKIKSIEPKCDVKHYISKKYNLLPYNYNIDYYYFILGCIKQEILQEYVETYNKVFYLDSDVVVLKDLFSEVSNLLDNYNILLKFYLQANRLAPGTLKNIMNSGTVGIKKSNDVDEMFKYFFEKAKEAEPSGNLEEYFIADFYENFTTKTYLIDDNINLTNNELRSYSIEEVKELSPMSFHPTYTINSFYPNRPYTKIGAAKALGKWFYD